MCRPRVLDSKNFIHRKNCAGRLDICFKSIYVHIVTYRYYHGNFYQEVVFHDDVIIFFLGEKTYWICKASTLLF